MELVWMLLLLPLCRGVHYMYQGTVMTYTPLQIHPDGAVTVEIRYKWSSRECYSYTTMCPPDGCLSSPSSSQTTIDESGGFCQVEYILTGTGYSSLLRSETLRWVESTLNGVHDASATIQLELKTRSDTGQPNTSPQTTILPVIRVAASCSTELRLLSFDPDGDLVQCRFANNDIDPNECVDCSPPSVLSLSASCTLTYTPNNVQGLYAVQLVMEDFPQHDITLTFPESSSDLRTTKDAISKIPVQFYLQVEASAESCTVGQYVPRFVDPTPEHGAQIVAAVSQTLQIHIHGEASHSTVSELVFSGPTGMEEGGSSQQYVLSWTPTNRELWRRFPVCFSVLASAGTNIFTSELRCVIISVELERSRVFRKISMLTSAPLLDTAVSSALEEQFKLELEKRGVLPGVKVKLTKLTIEPKPKPTQPGPDPPGVCKY